MDEGSVLYYYIGHSTTNLCYGQQVQLLYVEKPIAQVIANGSPWWTLEEYLTETKPTRMQIALQRIKEMVV